MLPVGRLGEEQVPDEEQVGKEELSAEEEAKPAHPVQLGAVTGSCGFSLTFSSRKEKKNQSNPCKLPGEWMGEWMCVRVACPSSSRPNLRAELEALEVACE